MQMCPGAVGVGALRCQVAKQQTQRCVTARVSYRRRGKQVHPDTSTTLFF